ncbi:MAG: hypothetical protein WDN45_15785 [Caulobacteraceae bacterium]
MKPVHRPVHRIAAAGLIAGAWGLLAAAPRPGPPRPWRPDPGRGPAASTERPPTTSWP